MNESNDVMIGGESTEKSVRVFCFLFIDLLSLVTIFNLLSLLPVFQEFILSEDYNKMTPASTYQGERGSACVCVCVNVCLS